MLVPARRATLVTLSHRHHQIQKLIFPRQCGQVQPRKTRIPAKWKRISRKCFELRSKFEFVSEPQFAFSLLISIIYQIYHFFREF